MQVKLVTSRRLPRARPCSQFPARWLLVVADATTHPSIRGLFDGLVPTEVVDAYEGLLATDGCAKSEAEALIGARIVVELTRWGMAHVQPHSPVDPAWFRPASPDIALQGVLVGHQSELARVHAIRSRALAKHGDHAQARAAITAAEEARTTAQLGDLHGGVAGEFAFDEAKLRYYQSLVVIDAEDPASATQAAAAAIRIYQATPARARSYGCEALARVQLARAQLMNHNLDTAAQALAGVLALDPQMRIGSLAQQLETCRPLLTGSAYRSSVTARQLDRQLAAFTSASATRALPGR